MNEKILEINNLKITFNGLFQQVCAVDNITFDVKKSEIVALVGESGSGKSVTVKSIMGLLQQTQIDGEIFFEGQNILAMKEKELSKLRGRNISMIFQEPMSALNPVMKIGTQLEEILKIHNYKCKISYAEKIRSTLAMMNISNPEEIMERYPFELSGGLCQRIVIAMAVICQPELIIADEPTTALDVTTQAEILCLLKETAKKIGSSVLIITHDLGVVAECADRVVVMYGGKLMEQGNVEEFFYHSKHPYSKGLLVSRPMNFNGRYPVIPGNITRNVNTIDGCPFAERCKHAQDICKKEFPKEQIISEEHKVWCWNTESEVV